MLIQSNGILHGVPIEIVKNKFKPTLDLFLFGNIQKIILLPKIP
jgi:hypothetical protein